MASVTVPLVSSFQTFDTNATANTGVLRDNQGNVTVAQCLAAELKSSGLLTLTRVAKSGVFTADTSGVLFSCDATSAAFAATLPPAASVTGRVYFFKKIDSTANAVTVTANGAETIDGSNTSALSSQWAKVGIISNGTSWEKIS